MRRLFLFLGLAAASALVTLAACGGSADRKVAGGAEGGGTASSSSGAAGGVTCAPPPPPSPTVPTQPGCAENMGSGWVSVPCLCDLWLTNTTPGPAAAAITLTVTPPELVSMGVDVDFDDPDASWLATWTKQPGSGIAFTVAAAGGTTTVTMGGSSLTLAPVPLTACETRKAVAHVSGMAVLSMHALLDDGTVFATVDATCDNPPPV